MSEAHSHHSTTMVRHLDTARVGLRRALEKYEAACELDLVTRMILDSYVAIIAARRELGGWRSRGLLVPFGGHDDQHHRREVLSVTGGNSKRDHRTTPRHLEVVR